MQQKYLVTDYNWSAQNSYTCRLIYMYSNFSAHDPTTVLNALSHFHALSKVTRWHPSCARAQSHGIKLARSDVPNYNMYRYVHLILNTPAGVTVFPSDNKTDPLKQNTSWLHSLFLIFLVSLFRLIFTSFPFFHSVFYPLYLYFSHFLHNFFINKVQACFFVFFFIYDLLLNRKSSRGFFKSVGKFHYINKSASLGFFFICDLLLNSWIANYMGFCFSKVLANFIS